MKHRKWIFAALALGILLAFCAAPERVAGDGFQTRLDRAGVPGEVPPDGNAILLQYSAL